MSPYMEEQYKNDEDTEYCLLSIMVHMGSKSNSGHYIAFIRPDMKDWYKFNDEHISKVSKSYVENMSFGKEFNRSYLDIHSSFRLLRFPIEDKTSLHDVSSLHAGLHKKV